MPPVIYLHDQERPSRKRRRPIVVCNECRRRKVACDKNFPCTQCVLRRETCVYGATRNEQSLRPVMKKSPFRPQAVTSNHSYSRGPPISNVPAKLPGAQQLGRCQDDGMVLSENDGSDCRDVNTAYELDQMPNILGEVAPKLKGRLSKTRLFGQSHWMNNMVEQVRLKPMPDCLGIADRDLVQRRTWSWLKGLFRHAVRVVFYTTYVQSHSTRLESSSGRWYSVIRTTRYL